MTQVMVQMAALIAGGVAWRWLRPGGLDAESVRGAITALVYYLLLPALILSVLWQAPLGAESLRIALAAGVGILAMLTLAWGVLRLAGAPAAMTGTLLLAAAWPNATYLGLPVLEAAMGDWARRIAIQYDLFACTPLLMTVGILIARHYGDRDDGGHAVTALLRVPPLWAAIAAAGLNTAGVPPPPALMDLLGDMGDGVPALMLLALGMSLTWVGWHRALVPALALVLILQLGLQPLVVAGAAEAAGLTGAPLRGVILEGAMPTMVLGVVLCDRYGLDTGLYAQTVTVSTVASLATTPLWFAFPL